MLLSVVVISCSLLTAVPSESFWGWWFLGPLSGSTLDPLSLLSLASVSHSQMVPSSFSVILSSLNLWTETRTRVSPAPPFHDLILVIFLPAGSQWYCAEISGQLPHLCTCGRVCHISDHTVCLIPYINRSYFQLNISQGPV